MSHIFDWFSVCVTVFFFHEFSFMFTFYVDTQCDRDRDICTPRRFVMMIPYFVEFYYVLFLFMILVYRETYCIVWVGLNIVLSTIK